jgi:hypothetical protein
MNRRRIISQSLAAEVGQDAGITECALRLGCPLEWRKGRTARARADLEGREHLPCDSPRRDELNDRPDEMLGG